MRQPGGVRRATNRQLRSRPSAVAVPPSHTVSRLMPTLCATCCTSGDQSRLGGIDPLYSMQCTRALTPSASQMECVCRSISIDTKSTVAGRRAPATMSLTFSGVTMLWTTCNCPRETCCANASRAARANSGEPSTHKPHQPCCSKNACCSAIHSRCRSR